MTPEGNRALEEEPYLIQSLVHLLKLAEESALLAGLAGLFALLPSAPCSLAQVNEI